ncbi:hypothetical protein PG993_004026 [Apiospora rasikravindrae]|uniref:Uncharacterized protein n=1 Tax=Apiospora rasikravindrae TaxID=990691 RepID=A0ABR1TC58_9PEZI
MAHVEDGNERRMAGSSAASGGEPTVHPTAGTQACPPQGYLYASDTNTTATQPAGNSYSNNSNNHYSYASPVSLASQWAPGGDIGAQFVGYNNAAGDHGQQHHASPGLSLMGSSPRVGDQQISSAYGNQIPRPTTSNTRPKPSPLQFEDSNHDNMHASPGLSTGTTYAPLGTPFQYSRVGSEARLLHTQRTPPPYAVVLAPPKKWYQLRQAWIMYFFFSFGLLCAAGHHLFYKSLDGKPAVDQLTMLRYGTVLAFAAKAGFLACIVTAFRQRIWATVRNKILSVAAIDSLFAATEDVVSLFNIEVYQKARIAMLLAVVAWLTPIVIILTSNTLVVELAKDVQDTNCTGIRTLNFSQEETEDWRDPTKINQLIGTSLSTWNTTKNPNLPDDAEHWFDYYTESSKQFRQVATLATFFQQVMTPTDVAWEICGNGWNCSYTINFTAPGYKCTELASDAGSKPRLGENMAPFGTEVLLPAGNNSYQVHATLGEYSKVQYPKVDVGGIPVDAEGKAIPNKELPPHLGAFRTEPIIWLGYSVRKGHDATSPNNSTEPGWNETFVPKIFGCEHYVTDYVVAFRFDGKEQSSNVTKRSFLRPVLDTVYQRDAKANDSTSDGITALPVDRYVYPNDTGPYRLMAAYHSLGAHLRGIINGTVTSNPVNNPIANSDALQTKLLDPRSDWLPYANLPDLVQSFYEDIILSLFSNQQFLAVVWAKKPDTKSGATTTGPKKGINGIALDNVKMKAAVDPTTLYPCTKSRYENRFKYIESQLWIVYAAAMLCALVAMALGTAAVLENEGVLRNTKFSSIVAATRGPALEKVRWREDDRGDITPDVKKMRVGYGVVHQSSPLSGGGLAGFGNDVPMDEDIARYNPRRSAMASPEAQGFGEEIRYGFGLEGDVKQTRREGSMFRGR